MQNDYLNNKNFYNQKVDKKYVVKSYKKKKIQNVDINKLLNRVKNNEKNEKKKSFILFGLATVLVGLVSIFVFV